MKQLILGVLAIFLCSSATAEYCNLSREEISGSNKFCFYGCVGGEKVITVSSLSRCPLLQVFNSSILNEPTSKLLESIENWHAINNTAEYIYDVACVVK